MDREEYRDCGEQHLRGQFGAKCVSLGPAASLNFSQKNPEQDKFKIFKIIISTALFL